MITDAEQRAGATMMSALAAFAIWKLRLPRDFAGSRNPWNNESDDERGADEVPAAADAGGVGGGLGAEGLDLDAERSAAAPQAQGQASTSSPPVAEHPTEFVVPEDVATACRPVVWEELTAFPWDPRADNTFVYFSARNFVMDQRRTVLPKAIYIDPKEFAGAQLQNIQKQLANHYSWCARWHLDGIMGKVDRAM